MAIQYRKILELAPDHSQRSVAASTGHSHREVKEVIEREKHVELAPPIDLNLTDTQLGRILFPELFVAACIISTTYLPKAATKGKVRPKRGGD